MLPTTLNTNEVKNSAGTEIEFQRIKTEGRLLEFAASNPAETPALTHRIKVSHQETGVGQKLRRRSLVRIDKTVMSGVDATVPITISAYCVLDIPSGLMSAITEATNVMAELNSFLSSLGATTTILYDGTGSGTAALLAGSL